MIFSTEINGRLMAASLFHAKNTKEPTQSFPTKKMFLCVFFVGRGEGKDPPCFFVLPLMEEVWYRVGSFLCGNRYGISMDYVTTEQGFRRLFPIYLPLE